MRALPLEKAYAKYEQRAHDIVVTALTTAAADRVESASIPVFAVADTISDCADVQRHQGRLPQIACRKGCAWCCYVMVTASAPEVLAVARYLRATCSADELSAIAEGVRQLDDVVHGMSESQRARVRRPCALLGADGSCAVYAARPVACRAWNSTDADACARFVEDGEADVAVEAVTFTLVTALRAGIDAGLRDVRRASEHLELTAALRIVLDEPDVEARWLAGEPVFTAAIAHTDDRSAEVRVS